MSLPKQVAEAAELAEELHGKMFAQEAAPQEEEAPPQEEPAPVEQDEPQQEETLPHDDDVEELRKFKERYMHLKGKYDAEVPRLHSELKDLKQSVFERIGEIAKQKEEELPPPKNERLEKIREEYGDEFINTIKAILDEEVSPLLKQNMQPVQEQIASIEDTQKQAAQQSFMSYLDSKVEGDWRALWSGQDPKFLEFLQQPDPSGLFTYGELALAYNDKWDADKLGIVFNTYLSGNKPQQPPAAKKPNPAQEAMVAPSRGPSTSTPQVNDKRIWTQETMAEFQKADRSGKYDATTSKAMWDDLLSALSENRIRL